MKNKSGLPLHGLPGSPPPVVVPEPQPEPAPEPAPEPQPQPTS